MISVETTETMSCGQLRRNVYFRRVEGGELTMHVQRRALAAAAASDSASAAAAAEAKCRSMALRDGNSSD